MSVRISECPCPPASTAVGPACGTAPYCPHQSSLPQGAPLPVATSGSPALASDLSYGAVTTRFNTYSVNTSTNLRVGVMMPGGPAGRQFSVQRAEVGECALGSGAGVVGVGSGTGGGEGPGSCTCQRNAATTVSSDRRIGTACGNGGGWDLLVHGE
jgi:hypothetical protein